MNNQNYERLSQLFSEAMGKTAQEREEFLSRHDRTDPELRRQLDSLLSAHDAAGAFLREPVFAAAASGVGEQPGEVIGGYKLLQKIGEGGFGIVFMAQQHEPVQRLVALKILKPGMDTREVVARFGAERQALALMDHPNIARVLDGGATKSGRPYFVMDLVKGVPITDFCDRRKLSTVERLQLFLKTCAGVQHAHQKGVIHRDLKPSNILVTFHDGEPVPKVIDFGVAKAIGEKLTERTLFTRFEQLLGTPAYMSPEQAEWSGLDVDTRTDIYALGVVLYELLTGTTPFDKDVLASAALDEVRRLLRETEPPAPSTRLLALGLQAGDIAHKRQSEPSTLARLIRGELDWIMLKSLERERNRRYETVNALARDIERHLNHEPVLACPPSRVYRATKFVRKHRVAVVAGTAVMIALLLGLAAMSVGFREARLESRRANEQAAIAKAVNEFLTVDLLGRANPTYTGNRDISMRQVLDAAAPSIKARFEKDPLVEAAIQFTVGTTYRWLGEMGPAEAHMQRAVDLRTRHLGRDHPDTLVAREELVLIWDNDPAKAEQTYATLQQLALAYRNAAGFQHDGTLNCYNDLATIGLCREKWDEAEQLIRETFAAERDLHGSEHEQTRVTMTLLAGIESHWARYQSSIALNEQVLQRERQHPTWHTPVVLDLQARNFADLADDSQAVKLLQEQLALLRPTYGSSNALTLPATELLGNAYGALGRWGECLAVESALIKESALITNGLWFVPGTALRGIVAGLLSADTNGCRKFSEHLIQDYSGATNSQTAAVVAIACLLQPELSSQVAPIYQLVDSAIPQTPFPDVERIAKGLSEFRRGSDREALLRVEGWEKVPGPLDSLRAIARSVAAVIYFRRGDLPAAQAALLEVDQFLARATYTGSLNMWYHVGAAAILRNEAERTIFQRDASPFTTSDALEQARERWRPIQQHLNDADRQALATNWKGAATNYLSAIRTPAFDWPAAEAAWRTENSILATKIGVTFLLAGDQANHERLCQDWMEAFPEYPGGFSAWHFLRTCLAGSSIGSSAVFPKVRAWAEHMRNYPLGTSKEAVDLVGAMLAYRSNQFQEASRLAPGNPRVSVKNANRLVRAMALQKLGQKVEAQAELRRAEADLADRLARLSGDLWWDLAWCQALLDEAHLLFREAK